MNEYDFSDLVSGCHQKENNFQEFLWGGNMGNGNNFHGDFQNDLLKSCIFPSDEIYKKKYVKNIELFKRSNSARENCSPSLLRRIKMNINQL